MTWECVPFFTYVVETSLEVRPKTILTFSQVWWYWFACNPGATVAGMKTSAVSFCQQPRLHLKTILKKQQQKPGRRIKGWGLGTPNEYLEVFFLSPTLHFLKKIYLLYVCVGEFQILVPQFRCGGQRKKIDVFYSQTRQRPVLSTERFPEQLGFHRVTL